MTQHPSSEYLSEYLDGELPPGERVLVEQHLADCADCAALLVDLRRVVARAQALEDRPPAHDLWPDVAAAIGGTPLRRRVAFTMPQLLAAGIALALLSGGAAWQLALHRGGSSNTVATAPAGTPTPAPSVPTVAAANKADVSYAGAVAELERTIQAGQGRLDSTTVRVLTEKLALIDRAIGEAERALAADPGSAYLHGHLTETRLRKLQLLRRAVELTRSAT